ncbi:MAG: NACHT domain-containing protein [Symploca sp. SIO2B6]|nr:NACHT domain-containing protein [Symploca sp. SIO2B6]
MVSSRALLVLLVQTFVNGVFCYLINQLPAIKELGIKEPGDVLGLILLSAVVFSFVNGLETSPQQNTAKTNSQGGLWIIVLLPLIINIALFGLLKLGFQPQLLQRLSPNISVVFLVLGILLPTLMILGDKSRLRKLIYLSLFGAGGFVTFNLAWNRQWFKVVVLASLTLMTALLPIVERFIKTFQEQGEKKLTPLLFALIDASAKSMISKLEMLVWELTSPFKHQYYQHLVYTYRTYRTQGLKTPGAFTPDLDKVFVPLRMASKSPGQISPAMIQKHESAGKLRIWDFLVEMRRQPAYKRIVVIGSPGSGKTTLLENLTLTYAQDAQLEKHPKAPKLIPVLLYLRKIREEITSSQPLDLAQLITKRLKSQESSLKLEPPPQWFENKLKHGKCLVMLDGLDEVADETQRQQVSSWVDKQMGKYPETTFIMTSRPFGYHNAQLKQVGISLEVKPFNLKQMEEFLHNWYLQNEVLRQARKIDPGVKANAEIKANDLIERIKNHPTIAAIALNPLLLTMIATVHDNRGALPGSRLELYEEICEVLLVRRQEVKGIVDQIQLKAAQKQSVLQVLALELMKLKTREFTLAVAKDIEDQMTAVAGSRANPQDFLKHIEQVCGLLVERDVGVYEFAHLSFQEYLTAVQVKETNQEQILIDNINNSWWHETIRLYAARSDTTKLIHAALESPTIDSLTLASDCLEEGKSVNPTVRQRLEEKLASGLESTELEIAKLAAQVKLSRRLKYAAN